MTKVMIIDDDDAICAILKDVLEIEGYDVCYSLSGEEGVRKYMDELPSVLLLDLRLPGMLRATIARCPFPGAPWFAGPANGPRPWPSSKRSLPSRTVLPSLARCQARLVVMAQRLPMPQLLQLLLF